MDSMWRKLSKYYKYEDVLNATQSLDFFHNCFDILLQANNVCFRLLYTKLKRSQSSYRIAV